MAIDPGSKRVGIAVTDPLGLTTQPLPFIPFSSSSKLIEDLRNLVISKSVGLIVVGLPVSLNGTLGTKAKECKDLAARIEEGCGVPVRLQDESFTSREAEDFLVNELDLSREKRKRVKDSLSACLILRSYMESHPSKKNPIP